MEELLRKRLDHALALLERARPADRHAGAVELVDLAHVESMAQAVRPRMVALLGDAMPELRAAGCAGLAALGPAPELLGQLEGALGDEDPRVRREASRSLGALGDRAVVPTLEKALGDPDGQVAFEAAVGLAQLGLDTGFEVLLRATSDRMRRFGALGALAQLGDARAIPAAEAVIGKFFVPDFEKTQAAGLLAKLGVEAGKAHLLARVQRRRADDRGLAMELCGEHRVLGAIPALRAAVADPRDTFRGAAARSLGMLGEDPSGTTLGGIATNPAEDLGVRCDAMEGLMFLGTPGALQTLETLHAEGESEEVREAAGEALDWLRDHRTRAMKRLVLFDLDGTLVETREDLASAANAALRSVGRPELPPEQIAGYVGRGSRKLIERALGPEQGALIDRALEAFFDFYGAHLLVKSAPYPGIAALLDALNGTTLVVCTNKPGKFARPLLEGLGLARRFALIHGAGDMPALKPDPRGALALCEAIGVAPGEACFVGDSQTDVLTAQSAGIPFVGVTWGYGGLEALRASGATRWASDAETLTRMILE